MVLVKDAQLSSAVFVLQLTPAIFAKVPNWCIQLRAWMRAPQTMSPTLLFAC